MLFTKSYIFQFLGHGRWHSELSTGARRRRGVQQAAEKKWGEGGRVHCEGGRGHSSQPSWTQVSQKHCCLVLISSTLRVLTFSCLPGQARFLRSCSWTKNVSKVFVFAIPPTTAWSQTIIVTHLPKLCILSKNWYNPIFVVVISVHLKGLERVGGVWGGQLPLCGCLGRTGRRRRPGTRSSPSPAASSTGWSLARSLIIHDVPFLLHVAVNWAWNF